MRNINELSTNLAISCHGHYTRSLTLATWLARTGVETVVVEKDSGPVTCGHADGLEPRTWEILDSFGLAAPLWDRANRTVELSHWVCLPFHRYSNTS